MVEEASGLDMNDSNSLAAVKAAMARPAEFSPKSVDSTRPSLYIETTDIEVDGQILANTSDYTSTDPTPSMPGSATQMWMESSPSAETISVTLQPMAIHRSKMEKSRISGQQKPALLLTEMPPGPEAAGPDSLLWKMVPRSKEVHEYVRLGKGKDDLVEVIYACMDGYVYFLDLETGEATRDPLYLGFTFKGQVHLIPEVIQLCMWAQVMTAMKALPGSLL